MSFKELIFLAAVVRLLFQKYLWVTVPQTCWVTADKSLQQSRFHENKVMMLIWFERYFVIFWWNVFCNKQRVYYSERIIFFQPSNSLENEKTFKTCLPPSQEQRVFLLSLVLSCLCEPARTETATRVGRGILRCCQPRHPGCSTVERAGKKTPVEGSVKSKRSSRSKLPVLLTPAEWGSAVCVTSNTSMGKTQRGISSHLAFFRTDFSAKADNTPAEKNSFAKGLANTGRGFYIQKFLAESLISA